MSFGYRTAREAASTNCRDKARHAAKEIEGRHMAIAEGFRGLSRIGFDKAAI
jgi:hypothetical protein